MKTDRERIKQIAKRGRVNLSFSVYELKQIDKKIEGTGECRAAHVKRIYLTHVRSSNTFKSE